MASAMHLNIILWNIHINVLYCLIFIPLLLVESNYYFLLFETEPLGGGAIAYKKKKLLALV
jgi:hypothetical protein